MSVRKWCVRVKKQPKMPDQYVQFLNLILFIKPNEKRIFIIYFRRVMFECRKFCGETKFAKAFSVPQQNVYECVCLCIFVVCSKVITII